MKKGSGKEIERRERTETWRYEERERGEKESQEMRKRER